MTNYRTKIDGKTGAVTRIRSHNNAQPLRWRTKIDVKTGAVTRIRIK